MTRTSITVAGFSDDENRTANLLLEQLAQKSSRNLLRTRVYDNKEACKHLGPTMPQSYRSLALIMGWSGTAVDSLADRCNLTDFVWPDGDLDGLGYREIWDGNYLSSEVNQGITSALIHATAFVIGTTKTTGTDEPPALLHFKSALDGTGEWDGRARRLTSFLSITGRDAKGKVSSFTLYLKNLTLRVALEGGKWNVIDRQAHKWGVPVEPLAYRPRLGRPFGTSRISRPLMSFQAQATRELYRLEGHMDVYSWPEYWLLGADETVFKNADGSQKAMYQVMLGRMKGIPDDQDADPALARADVKQFAAASPEPHLAAMNTFAKLFAREAQLPDNALAITDVSNPTSAESYDAAQQALVKRAENTCDDMSTPLRRAMVRALAMANGLDEIPKEWRSIETKWRNPRFLSRAAEADAGSKQVGSIPWLAETEVGLELIGLDSQQIRRAMADRRRMQATERLKLLATASGANTPTAAPAAPATANPTPEVANGNGYTAAG